MNDSHKKIKWYALAFMCFSTLWGFGNVVNGFVYFNGIQVIFSWILMFALYFIPYALMVGEMGSAFKSRGGGVTSWIQETSTKKLAYYAGWTYWAVHITYIASKGSGGLKALSWLFFQNAETYDSMSTMYIQLATLAVFLLFCFEASKGLNPLKKLATLAGSSMFIMSILFILMMFAAPAINPNAGYLNMDWSFNSLIPNINLSYLSNLSILVFAVGGIEKISPYVNNTEGNPAKTFPKAVIFAAIMVVVCAIFGTIAMGMMFDPAATVLKQLTKLNSITMPLRYLWVFIAYILLRKQNEKFEREYKFVKNNKVALFFGAWCFLVTLASCVLGMISDDPVQLALNVLTPVILIALGLILPIIRKKQDQKELEK